ncbi:hypothetical protein WJX73_006236 [Symbiochloris irregularis]|uniref:Vacuolar-sorting receptor 1 n=1 Tax=Symbiochloris irregularis TaxID=706552 RepID=A0AAW1NR51_9CHLO
MRIWPICLALFAALHCAECKFDIEKGGLRIKLPASAAAEHSGGFEIALGNFGSPRYGGELLAKMVYVDPEAGYPSQCFPEACNYACEPFSEASPPVDLHSPDGPVILMVDRGPQDSPRGACKFAKKVWNAQQAGAAGVLVVNYEDHLTTMEAPKDADGQDEDTSYKFLKNITIPAAFIGKSNGDIMKDLLKRGEQVHAIFDWKDVLPKRSLVSWEFWTNSNDQCGPICDVQKEFIKEFVPVAHELEHGNWTRFTPHFILWICPISDRNTPECSSQCIHQGRYCSPDPDGDLHDGYTGKEVVQENLRQLCVYKLGNDSGRPWVWWEYVTKFAVQCSMDSSLYSQECAEQVWDDIGANSWSSRDALHECIGDIDADTRNEIFENEMDLQKGDSQTGEVYILPTIRINGGQYRGKLAYTEVLRALCAAFEDEQKQPPPVCLKVADDSCRPGSLGDAMCSRNIESGLTQCSNTFNGYTCTCGPGFLSTGLMDSNGYEICAKISTKTGMPTYAVILIVAGAIGIVAAACYAAYRLRIRSAMHQEIRDIMAQYMPLEDNEGGTLDPNAASRRPGQVHSQADSQA